MQCLGSSPNGNPDSAFLAVPPWEVANDDCSHSWVPAMHMGDRDGVSKFPFLPGPVSAVGRHRENAPANGFLSVCLK